MIRIKPKKSNTTKKLQKQEKFKAKKNEEQVAVKKSKALKHGVVSKGATKTIKKKNAKNRKLHQNNKEIKTKKMKKVLAKFNESEETTDMPFPLTIDLKKHIRLAPKESKIALSKDSIEIIKQSDMGMFTSISNVMNTGDKELGVDELLEKKNNKPKPYSGLPGWGNWATIRTIHSVQDVKKPFIRREEQKKKRVHIAELPSKNNHQVTEVPFPFVSIADYESSIRTNYSQEFNSRRVHQILSKSKKKVEMELDEQ